MWIVNNKMIKSLLLCRILEAWKDGHIFLGTELNSFILSFICMSTIQV